MARRLVDSVTGIGSVQAGGLTLRATRYRLSFWVNDDVPPQSSDGAAAGGSRQRSDASLRISGARQTDGRDGDNYTVLRGRRDILKNSDVGAIFLSRWQPYLMALLAIVVTGVVALAQAPELRWYVPGLNAIGTSLAVRIEQKTDEYAFLVDQLGMAKSARKTAVRPAKAKPAPPRSPGDNHG